MGPGLAGILAQHCMPSCRPYGVQACRPNNHPPQNDQQARSRPGSCWVVVRTRSHHSHVSLLPPFVFYNVFCFQKALEEFSLVTLKNLCGDFAIGSVSDQQKLSQNLLKFSPNFLNRPGGVRPFQKVWAFFFDLCMSTANIWEPRLRHTLTQCVS